ncbi:MAG: hypothetical protein RLZZ416_348 [Candidatus Parcubacteria bacterium]|jgi:DNA helicase-2/ATP-dependent DNA helicase PcrA
MSHLDSLNKKQLEAVTHLEGPLLIVAGAGAGKTKTITHRIAHLIRSGVAGNRILAVTFTNKAAGEMRERVRNLLEADRTKVDHLGGAGGMPLVATFHSLAVRLLREFGPNVGVSARFTIADRDDQLRTMKRLLRATGMEDENPSGILAAISREKGSGVDRAEYAEEARSHRQRVVARAWEMYESALMEEGALDFDDLLQKARELLKRRSDVVELLRSRWSHITIDEYQDTNVVQYDIARLLAGERQNICVVGDLDQCIYTWRQAKLENLLSFERSFPGTKTVVLEENYRSTGTIIAAANAIISKNANRLPKVLRSTRETGEPIYLYEARDEMEEAWFVAQQIEQLMKKKERAKETAVLYRNNFQSRALEEAFLALGIPYRVIGTRFFERKEVKDVLAYARAALNPKRMHDLLRIIATPPRGIGRSTLTKVLAGAEGDLSSAARAKLAAFREMLKRVRHALETLPLSEALRFLIEESGLERMYKEKAGREEAEHFDNVKELVNLAVRYDTELPPRGIELLLEEAALQSDQDEMRDDERVSLMTVHAAKGLEFESVFLTGLEQGLFPSQKLDEGADPEEERRLFYVALTRAKDRLFLTFARSRLKFGSREPAVPSEFLGDIDDRLLAWANTADAAEEVIE